MHNIVSSKIQYLNELQKKTIHITSDIDNDYGQPKGTALVRNAIYPFSMGNEAFDGFLVVEIYSDKRDHQLIYKFEKAIESVINKKQLAGISSHIVCEKIVADIITQSEDSIRSCQLLGTNYSNISSVKKIAPILIDRMIESLGTLRPDSVSKFIELCRSDTGKRFIVIHCGVSSMQYTLFYLLKMYGHKTKKFDINKLSKNDLSLLNVDLDMNENLSNSIIFTLDCLKLFAHINRLTLVDSITKNMGMESDYILQFHEVHASIERISGTEFLHQNSINRLKAGSQIGFIAGPPNYLIKFNSETIHFYPHGLKNNFDEAFNSNQKEKIISYIKLSPLINSKDIL